MKKIARRKWTGSDAFLANSLLIHSTFQLTHFAKKLTILFPSNDFHIMWKMWTTRLYYGTKNSFLFPFFCHTIKVVADHFIPFDSRHVRMFNRITITINECKCCFVSIKSPLKLIRHFLSPKQQLKLNLHFSLRRAKRSGWEFSMSQAVVWFKNPFVKSTKTFHNYFLGFDPLRCYPSPIRDFFRRRLSIKMHFCQFFSFRQLSQSKHFERRSKWDR